MTHKAIVGHLLSRRLLCCEGVFAEFATDLRKGTPKPAQTRAKYEFMHDHREDSDAGVRDVVRSLLPGARASNTGSRPRVDGPIVAIGQRQVRAGVQAIVKEKDEAVALLGQEPVIPRIDNKIVCGNWHMQRAGGPRDGFNTSDAEYMSMARERKSSHPSWCPGACIPKFCKRPRGARSRCCCVMLCFIAVYAQHTPTRQKDALCCALQDRTRGAKGAEGASRQGHAHVARLSSTARRRALAPPTARRASCRTAFAMQTSIVAPCEGTCWRVPF